MQEFNNLTEPFRNEKFEIFQRGISDNPSIDVYINERKDFAFLHPAPSVDYSHYTPRVKKFGLTDYKKGLGVIKRRFDKIEHHLKKDHQSLLEIGAGDGAFLKTVRENLTHIHLTAVDQDQNTLPSRAANSDENFDSLAELINHNKEYDVICLFHVLEHIIQPVDFLAEIRKLMATQSLLIIEVPSLMDPLLSLYNNKTFSNFIFSSQHPYVYSPSSLRRLMEAHGFQATETIHFQRYGLENHLNWLTQAQPGGNKEFQSTFKDLESGYMAKLEQSGKTDTVIWVGTRGAK
jgi:2-polyprenyl-3-methyl-5-hydroxy-6-metoxy-1,4-benzoquinol methylase